VPIIDLPHRNLDGSHAIVSLVVDLVDADQLEIHHPLLEIRDPLVEVGGPVVDDNRGGVLCGGVVL